MNRDQVAAAVGAERHRVCDLVEGFDDADWATPSLCSAWNVREVVAHLTTTTRETIGSIAVAAIKARGSFDRMTTDVARDRAAAFSTDELVQQLRVSAGSLRRFPGSSPMDPLMDVVVHGHDIARPLARHHPLRLEVAAPVLTYVAGNRLLGGPRRLAGLRLVATDLDWSWGQGPQVRGSATDLLLVAAGRPAGLAGLTGPGVAPMAERLQG